MDRWFKIIFYCIDNDPRLQKKMSFLHLGGKDFRGSLLADTDKCNNIVENLENCFEKKKRDILQICKPIRVLIHSLPDYVVLLKYVNLTINLWFSDNENVIILLITANLIKLKKKTTFDSTLQKV